MVRLVGIAVTVVLAVAGPGPTTAQASTTPATVAATVSRPFADTSPLNVPVVGAPMIDPNSPAMVARAARAGLGYANLVEFGIPVYEATPSTPRQSVRCTITDWGPCPFGGGPRPIPVDAKPSAGSDGAMVVVDRTTGTIDEYWQAAPASTGWTTSWGAINSMSGSGWGGGSTGAGASRLAGVVRVAEIQAGVIPHALVVQTDTVCATTFRPPALKTDGDSTRSDCIPEGARLQLDPAIDVAAIPGITPGERAVARALQVYGAYLIDRAGTSLAVSFEVAPDASATGPGSVYTSAGFGWDYDGMPHIPWNRLRVLQAWDR
ncbi:hypothetical protein [Nakamurella sp.]|uniref:hypothetical protein n=1 Tax=Nakamurella sp. TaxID=1869182 RepID=UPI003783824C